MNINATLLAQAIVMIVFVAICWRYIYPPILSVMQEREKKISDGLEAAKKADDSLEEAQLAFDQELDKAKAEAAELIDKANQRASQIVGDAKGKAQDEAEKILASASKTIENETNKAKEELKVKTVTTSCFRLSLVLPPFPGQTFSNLKHKTEADILIQISQN